MAKYAVQQHPVDVLLGWVKGGQIAIPEMQRPFVWNSTKVRDLLDSLYNGYPVGYLITWQSRDVGLKDNSSSNFKQILIDGQQRVTAMTAALVGEPIVDKDYKRKRVRIAFNPMKEEFETTTPVILRDPQWIPDVAEFFQSTNMMKFTRDYLARNPGVDEDQVDGALQRLASMKNAQVGVITLHEDLDINTVTEIFIRINSKGVPLSSADFAMSKIASHGKMGSDLRKLIDYFCHLSVAPHVYDNIVENDPDFAGSEYLSKIQWLRTDSSELYDPSYKDVIRVAGLKEFRRGRMSALVSVLSGRDFETREFSEDLAVESFNRLRKALFEIVNQHNFQQFVLTVTSAGFTDPTMITSKNALNFAYALFLHLREQKWTDGKIKNYVRRWLVLALLTSRYSGSAETVMEQDFRRIHERGADVYLETLESSTLSSSYWDATLPDAMEVSSVRSAYFQLFLAAQIKQRARGFLSKSITVADMVSEGGKDIHHIVPKAYLVKNGIVDRTEYNQIANYAVTETPVNRAISDSSPATYMGVVDRQCATGQLHIGELIDSTEVESVLRENAVPPMIRESEARYYPEFLSARRKLMASYIRDYYKAL